MGTGERWGIFNNHLLGYVQTQHVQHEVSVLHAKYNVFEELNSENKSSWLLPQGWFSSHKKVKKSQHGLGSLIYTILAD